MTWGTYIDATDCKVQDLSLEFDDAIGVVEVRTLMSGCEDLGVKIPKSMSIITFIIWANIA